MFTVTHACCAHHTCAVLPDVMSLIVCFSKYKLYSLVQVVTFTAWKEGGDRRNWDCVWWLAWLKLRVRVCISHDFECQILVHSLLSPLPFQAVKLTCTGYTPASEHSLTQYHFADGSLKGPKAARKLAKLICGFSLTWSIYWHSNACQHECLEIMHKLTRHLLAKCTVVCCACSSHSSDGIVRWTSCTFNEDRATSYSACTQILRPF